MTERASRAATVATGLAASLAALLFALQVAAAWPAAGDALARLILTDTVLPRGAVALLGGAALGLSGALLQRVLRNPIADASTLGIVAGAQLALTAATIYAPVLMSHAREPVAFAGGAAALALVLALAWRRGLQPVTVALCGMLVSLIAASASATIVLANGEYMMSLFIWGGGSLAQIGWGASLWLLAALLAAGAATFLLRRPLALLGFDDGQAKALGLRAGRLRLLALVIAVSLATLLTAHVGVIGFVGLAAPHLARLLGVRRPSSVLLAAPALGAILLFLTDGLVQRVAAGGAEAMPTGAATALIGGPILIWLLPRLKSAMQPPSAASPTVPVRRRPRSAPLIAALALALLLVLAIALLVGPGIGGWSLATGSAAEVLPWRWPRVLIAGACGAMLGAGGFVLQRITGNPLASPEVLGISSGAGLGLAAVLLFAPAAGPLVETGGAMAGSLAALVLLVALNVRSGFSAERMLLGGVAIGALSGALVTTVTARGGTEALRLLDWISGSTQLAEPSEALTSLLLAFALVLPLPLMARWFAILPLGAAPARAIGLSAGRSAGILVVIAALLSAVATLGVGPLSFAGLIAPHMARLSGLARPVSQLAASVLIGALLLVFADFMARSLAFPYQLPLGLFASLVGGPYLIWLLNRGALR